MSFTRIDIVSNALTLLGKGPITTVESGGDFAKAVDAFFDLLYPSSISKYEWRFATKIQQLSLTLETPPVDYWTSIYQLPGDYLSLVRLYDRTLSFQIYKNQLWTTASHDSLFIEYRFLPVVTALPSYFVEYFTYLLAETYALSVSNQTNYVKVFSVKAKTALVEGLATDAKAHPNYGIQDMPYIDVRGGNRHGVSYS